MESFKNNFEKVVLVNQYEILKKIDPENSNHYEEIIEIIKRGYSIFYSMIDEWFGTDMPSDEGEFVLDILDFYTAVELYKKNNPTDEEILNHQYSEFRGFDGNHEGQYWGFVRFLIEKQNKFSEVGALRKKHDNYNSHDKMIPTYKEIVRVWKSKGGLFPQKREEILIPLNAVVS